MANTAIEAAIDRIGTDYHPLSRLTKDIGSACVLVDL
ncbi:diacylglycerol kinase [Vibrio anguillarum]|nr:diacylglycerol kinase [Vibrio anguillarum]